MEVSLQGPQLPQLASDNPNPGGVEGIVSGMCSLGYMHLWSLDRDAVEIGSSGYQRSLIVRSPFIFVTSTGVHLAILFRPRS